MKKIKLSKRIKEGLLLLLLSSPVLISVIADIPSSTPTNKFAVEAKENSNGDKELESTLENLYKEHDEEKNNNNEETVIETEQHELKPSDITNLREYAWELSIRDNKSQDQWLEELKNVAKQYGVEYAVNYAKQQRLEQNKKRNNQQTDTKNVSRSNADQTMDEMKQDMAKCFSHVN